MPSLQLQLSLNPVSTCTLLKRNLAALMPARGGVAPSVSKYGGATGLTDEEGVLDIVRMP